MVEWHKVHVLCNVHVCWGNRLFISESSPWTPIEPEGVFVVR